MDILLTGATGFIGSTILRRLVADDHHVTALVRSDDSAHAVGDMGATPLLGDITDTDWLTAQIASSDGAVHTASPGDATSPDVDRAIAAAATRAFAGAGKPYVHTSGIWIFGTGDAITESSPLDPPPLVAWRDSVEQIVLNAEAVRGIVVVPAIAYGRGTGIPALLAGAPVTDAGELTVLGDGRQHWPTVHVDDLADLYVRALRQGAGGHRYIGASGANPTVRELAEAAAGAAGLRGVRAEGVAQSRARLGEAFADALLLDQQASGSRARDELGWSPAGPSLVEELSTGSYAPVAASVVYGA
jgi:nucleoside-diphosphate-sugar epimerase